MSAAFVKLQMYIWPYNLFRINIRYFITGTNNKKIFLFEKIPDFIHIFGIGIVFNNSVDQTELQYDVVLVKKHRIGRMLTAESC